MSKRPWNEYPKNVKEQLNGYSGVAGVGGAVGSAVSPVLFPAAMVATASTIGIAVTGIAIVYALIRAIPKMRVDAKDLIGTSVTLQSLSTIFPPISKVGVLGISQAGKTTLRYALLQQEGSTVRTQHEGAYIMSLQSTPQRYIALLDGAGEQYSQQFAIAEISDILIVVLDHNETDNDPTPKQKRLAAHEEFLKQLRLHLLHRGITRKKAVIFLCNKSDLWVQSSGTDQQNFKTFCKDESEKWQGAFANNIFTFYHSNEKAGALNALVTQLKTHC